MPCERTFRRLLEVVDPDSLKDVLVGWMRPQDPAALELMHPDGKVLKHAQPAPARPTAAEAPSVPPEPCEIPPELQKPKADKALTLANFITSQQRLIDQIAVPCNTNEEAAVAAHLLRMDLAGVCVTADAAHTTKANARQLSQNKGAEFLLFLKANQPLALAKAEQLLPGNFPPSSQQLGQGPRTDGVA